MAGLGVILLGQLSEAIGAFVSPTNPLTNLHDVGVIVGPAGLMILIFSLLATVATWGATKLGFRESRWFPATLIAAAVAAAMFVIGAFVFGY